MAATQDAGGYWSTPTEYLPEAQQQHNAVLIYQALAAQGWTLNAVAGALGNIQYESTVNPAIWQGRRIPDDPLYPGQSYDPPRRIGFGLAQWTNAPDDPNKYVLWCNQHGLDYTLGTSNIAYLVTEPEHGGNWQKPNYLGLTWGEYIVSTAPPEDLAQTWIYGYERPASPDVSARRAAGRKWYDYLAGTPVTTIPVWLLWRMSRNNNLIGGGPIA